MNNSVTITATIAAGAAGTKYWARRKKGKEIQRQVMKPTNAFTTFTVPGICTFGLCLLAISPCQAGDSHPGIAPPNSKSYGKSLVQWHTEFFEPRESDLVGHVLLLARVQPDAPSGSGTLADPLILTGHADITIKAGTSIFSDLISFYGELYEDDSTDSPVPDEWWGTYVTGDVTIDGKQVLTDVAAYYTAPHYFDPPLFYDEPTPYGAIAMAFFQGTGFMIRPLAVGVHTLQENAFVLVPPDNGVIPETGIEFHSSWTITVIP